MTPIELYEGCQVGIIEFGLVGEKTLTLTSHRMVSEVLLHRMNYKSSHGSGKDNAYISSQIL
jgi:hypothetical protein